MRTVILLVMFVGALAVAATIILVVIPSIYSPSPYITASYTVPMNATPVNPFTVHQNGGTFSFWIPTAPTPATIGNLVAGVGNASGGTGYSFSVCNGSSSTCGPYLSPDGRFQITWGPGFDGVTVAVHR